MADREKLLKIQRLGRRFYACRILILLTTKAIPGMNNHDCNCISINPDEWHQNLLEGCNDVVIRLTHVIDILKKCHQTDLPLSRRLRLVGVGETTLVPFTVKTAPPVKTVG